MRTPTSLEQRWLWWEAAVSGAEMPSISVDQLYNEIHCGYFKLRKFPYGEWPRGPWIPARVWMVDGETDEAGELLEDEKWFAEIDGKKVNPWRNWHWIRQRPITEEEFNWLTAMSPLLPAKIPSR